MRIDLIVANFRKDSEETSMLAFPRQQDHRSASWTLARWWRVQADKLLGMAGLTRGVDTSVNSRELVPPAAGEADLLRRRMVTLDLDPYEWALAEPALVRHLHRCCSQCDSQLRCTYDLAAESTDVGPQKHQLWRKYCPNAATLETLSTVQERSTATPTFSFPYLG